LACPIDRDSSCAKCSREVPARNIFVSSNTSGDFEKDVITSLDGRLATAHFALTNAMNAELTLIIACIDWAAVNSENLEHVCSLSVTYSPRELRGLSIALGKVTIMRGQAASEVAETMFQRLLEVSQEKYLRMSLGWMVGAIELRDQGKIQNKK
jgi:hypothetical protein